MSLLGYWDFDKSTRNYGSSGYGSILTQKESGNRFVGNPIDLPSGFYYSFEGSGVSGQLIEHGSISFGLIGLKSGVIPYVKSGPYFYKPDNKYATKTKTNWGIYYRPEAFADKDFTLSIYRDNQDIYTDGVFSMPLYGDILFCNTSAGSIRLYSDIPIDPIYSGPSELFGDTGPVGSGLNLFIGTPSVGIGSGFNLAMGAIDSCYLLDEQNNILYDESGNPLLAEGCIQYGGILGGFDMYISGQAFTEFVLPLYLHQTDSTYSFGSGIPLLLQGGGTEITSNMDLTLYNSYSSIGSGVNLFIESPGTNDGYTPIGSGFPLFIQRNENLGFDLIISGGYTTNSGNINLYLNANTYPTSGNLMLSMPLTYGTVTNSGTFLYTAGW